MLYYIIGFYVLSFIYAVTALLYLRRRGTAMKVLTFNSISGLFLLSLLKITATYTTLAVNINIVSVISALVLGVPGVGAYLLINFLFL